MSSNVFQPPTTAYPGLRDVGGGCQSCSGVTEGFHRAAESSKQTEQVKNKVVENETDINRGSNLNVKALG